MLVLWLCRCAATWGGQRSHFPHSQAPAASMCVVPCHTRIFKLKKAAHHASAVADCAVRLAGHANSHPVLAVADSTLRLVARTPAGGLGHANPKVKEETLGWLRVAVCEEPKQTLSKLAPLLLQPASKCAEEAAPSLREAALAFMVAFAIQVRARRCRCVLVLKRFCLSAYVSLCTARVCLCCA